MMAGENCIIGASGFGYRAVRAETFDIGMSIIADSGESKEGQTFYTRKVTKGSFDLTVMFASYEEYKDFTDWMTSYARLLSRDAESTGPMRVIIPSRNFDRFGVPNEGYTMGDEVKALVRRQTYSFVGASDPIDYDNQSLAQFILPVNDPSEAPYFYPAGTQLAGSEGAGGIDTGYDVDPNDIISKLFSNLPRLF